MEEDKTLLKAQLVLVYYKNKNILDRYTSAIERLVIDNDCLDILENPNEMLYITPLKKIKSKED